MKRAVLFAIALSLATSAFAPTSISTTNTNNITASVAPKCTIGAFAIAFGAYDPFSATALDQTGTVSINCTKGTSGLITLNLGANATGLTRRMQDFPATGNYLTYEIYSDSTRTTVWNTINTVTLGPSASKNTAMTATAYGRVAAGQDVQAGAAGVNYQDTIVATVTF
jgi:spore coat protein U domain-containing protein, fimbrial subunit CupE1/2/3/6